MANRKHDTTDKIVHSLWQMLWYCFCICVYVDLKVTQAVEMMKAMGFNDDGGWLTRLLETTDGDIAQALDTLKLSAQQASRLA